MPQAQHKNQNVIATPSAQQALNDSSAIPGEIENGYTHGRCIKEKYLIFFIHLHIRKIANMFVAYGLSLWVRPHLSIPFG